MTSAPISRGWCRIVRPFAIVAFLLAASSMKTVAQRAASKTQHPAGLRAESDTVEDLVFTNTRNVPVYMWQVAVYHCENITHDCGVTDPHLIVAPRAKVTLRRMGIIPKIWRLYYEVYWRPLPADHPLWESITVGRSGPATLLVAPRALTRDGFRPKGKSHSYEAWNLLNATRRLAVWVEQDTATRDSLHILLSGARMPVDAQGHVVADEDKWAVMSATDTADVTSLEALLGDVRRAESSAVSAPLDTAEALHDAALGFTPRGHLILVPRALEDGRYAVCRYSPQQPSPMVVVELRQMDDWCQPEGDAPRLQYNSFVAVDPRSVSVGQQIDVCAAYTQSIPGVFDRVEWHQDASKCPADGPAADPSQPNVLVLMLKR